MPNEYYLDTDKIIHKAHETTSFPNQGISVILTLINTHRLTGLIIAFLCLHVPSNYYPLIAQSSHQIFEHITTDHGLSSNKVESIIQDHEGFYWISTANGLNRFDGTHFKIFRKTQHDSTSLTDNTCRSLVEDKNGDIWIATSEGVSRYHRNTGKFSRYYFERKGQTSAVTNRITDIGLGYGGSLWISGYGLWKFDIEKKQKTLLDHNGTGNSIPPYSLISQMHIDTFHHGVWLMTDSGLVYYDELNNIFYHLRHNPPGWNVFDVADDKELAVDPDHHLWFRNKSTGTLNYFNMDSGEIIETNKEIISGVRRLQSDDKGRIWIFYYTRPTEIFDPHASWTDTHFFTQYHWQSMSDPKGTSVFKDRMGNYWISSHSGINIYKPENQFYKIHMIAPKDKEDRPLQITIRAIHQTDPGELWLSTDHGLYQYTPDNGALTKQAIPGDPYIGRTLCFVNDQLWFYSIDELWCYDFATHRVVHKKKLTHGAFFLLKGHDDELWLGVWTSGLYRINSKNGEIRHFQHDSFNDNSLKTNYVMSGLVDEAGIWIGYNLGKGFSHYHFSTDRWRHYSPWEKNQTESIPPSINPIVPSDHGTILMGSYGDGIFEFNPVDSTLTNYLQYDGLSSNYINSIIQDAEGNYWVSTSDGINFKAASQQVFEPLHMGLIFSNNDYVQNGIKSADGKIYFFCGSQLAEITPAAYQQISKEPEVVISGFKVFDDDVLLPSGDQEIRLSYKENFFSFTFSQIKTHPSIPSSYAYMLAGFDKDWNYTSEQNVAVYTNVPHGSYSFIVKVLDDAGQWSDPLVNVPLKITPPYWRTWWFISLCLAAFSILLVSLHRYRISQVKKIISMRTKISQDLHDDIGGSLSSIQIYSAVVEREMKDNPDKAGMFLQQIKSNSRQVMEDISDIVWANKAMDQKDYSMSMRIKSYGHDLLSQKNIDCHYDIEPWVDQKITRPEARRNILLIIKEGLHNVSKYSNATSAWVKLALIGTNLEIEVRDNGIGFDMDSVSRGNGLSNMRQRAETLKGNFQVDSTPGYGTIVHVKIPLPNISGE